MKDSEAAELLHHYDTMGINDFIEPSLIEQAQEVAAQSLVSRHARSLQPITVEGLVAMGFTRGRYGLFHEATGLCCYESHGEIGNWLIGNIPIEPLNPESMFDLDHLIERLSR